MNYKSLTSKLTKKGISYSVEFPNKKNRNINFQINGKMFKAKYSKSGLIEDLEYDNYAHFENFNQLLKYANK